MSTFVKELAIYLMKSFYIQTVNQLGLATMYVRVVDEGGEPYENSYTICFENPDGASLTIYRYIGGVWTAIQVAATNPICVSATGAGAFYLGG